MKERNYTIVIRTLGRAGEKYQRLLESIDKQSLRPVAVKVYLPYGYDLPPERLGWEEFVFCTKGMVHQRAAAFAQCDTDYTLALDDDVKFDSDFVERLFETLESAHSDFVSPIVRENLSGGGESRKSFLSPCVSQVKDFKDWLLGVSMTKEFKEPFLVKIWKTGGFLIKRNIDDDTQYFSQSGHGTCVFGRTKALKNLRFEDELWLENTRYALPEDMVMFYKLYLQGNVIAVNRDVRFLHLDAGSSLENDDKKLNTIFASARNGMIFWHRFIYSPKSSKALSVLCLGRRMFCTCLFAFLKGIAKGNFKFFVAYLKGYASALEFIKSEIYRNLPEIGVHQRFKRK